MWIERKETVFLMNNIYSTMDMHSVVCSFCFVLTRLPVYISIALNYFQNKKIFSDNAKIL